MLFEVNNLVKQFGSRTVLDIEKLSFLSGKIYALIGPNGAGKTTLLNQLAFLDQPTSGTLSYCGEAVRYDRRKLTRLRRQVVLVDQSPILFSGSVWRNVEFGLKARGMATKERDEKIIHALEQVGMVDFARADVFGLSGGEVKRIALARALALDPDVLLCDEPTANVDREHQEIILNIIEQANSARNTSIIFSTHYLSQSRRLAHETVLLQNGRLSAHLEENLFSGSIRRSADGAPCFRLAGRHDLELDLSADTDGARTYGQVHVMPGKISVRPVAENGQNDAGIVGSVRNIAAENGNIRIIIDIGVILTVLMEIRHFNQNPIQICQDVEVQIPPESIVPIA